MPVSGPVSVYNPSRLAQWKRAGWFLALLLERVHDAYGQFTSLQAEFFFFSYGLAAPRPSLSIEGGGVLLAALIAFGFLSGNRPFLTFFVSVSFLF